jgi:hypothetical protein
MEKVTQPANALKNVMREAERIYQTSLIAQDLLEFIHTYIEGAFLSLSDAMSKLNGSEE